MAAVRQEPMAAVRQEPMEPMEPMKPVPVAVPLADPPRVYRVPPVPGRGQERLRALRRGVTRLGPVRSRWSPSSIG